MPRVPSGADGGVRLACVRAVPARGPGAVGPHRARRGGGSHRREGIVPLLRDSIQVSACLLEAPRLELPDALTLAPATLAAHEARSGERMNVLRDSLTRDGGPRAQMHDGEWPFRAEAGDEPQTRLVPERREDRRSAGQPRARDVTLPR